MDVADRAFQYADEAANGAQRAAAQSSPRNEERLEAVMHAAHAHYLHAERHHGMARKAHADGLRTRLEHHASEVISAAADSQRAAGVAMTADALKEVLDGLKPAAERARQAAAREQLQAELESLRAERDRELTAVTRMDAANRELLQGAQWRAESVVPALGWWPALAADLAHAHQGRLWLDETGAPRLVKEIADGRVVAGRKVNADRVAMLRAAGFLVTGSDGQTSTLLHPSDMGREALYLATLYPEGLHADERAAYEARYKASRQPGMNNEERKSAARRLPPLDRHAMRASRAKPVLLEDSQVPQISAEGAARHADMAELAQRLWRWAAMSRGELSDVTSTLNPDGARNAEELTGEAGQDVGDGDERAADAPSGELPSAPEQNAPQPTTTSATTSPRAAAAGTNDPPASDPMPLQVRTQGLGDEPVEPEGSAHGLAEAPASWDDHEAPAQLVEPPGPQEDPAADTLQPSVQEQPELFSVQTPAPTPPQDGTAPDAAATAPEQELPRYSQARQQILDEIARGNITEVGGRFMQRVPRRSVHPVGSPQRINAVLDEELAERVGERIRLSERGFAWYAHHNRDVPAAPRDVETVEQAPLPPIDYAPLHALPVLEGSVEAPQPPAPAPLLDDWYKSGGRASGESTRDAYAMGAEAAERAARSTARDVAVLAAGPDHSGTWTRQYPLAQFDENAAAALESLTDSVARVYAARAVRNLRGALEGAGKEAADHYVANVRSPQWKTIEGSQSDDVHRDRVRGVVVTYCLSVREHARAYGLDADTIVHVLEDAAGWTGRFRPLGRKAVAYPDLPAAESVAEAAQYVANALRLYALGRSDTVDTAADLRRTWHAVEPRPAPTPTAAVEEAAPQSADVAPASSEATRTPAAGTSGQHAPAVVPPVPAQVQHEVPRARPTTGPQTPDTDTDRTTGQASPSINGAGAVPGTTVPPAADDSTRPQQPDRQDLDQAEQDPSGTSGQAEKAPQQMSGEDEGSVAPLQAASAAPSTTGGPALATPAGSLSTFPGPEAGQIEPMGGVDASVRPVEAAPPSVRPDQERQETHTDLHSSAAEIAAPPGNDRPDNAEPASENRPQPRPAAVRVVGQNGSRAARLPLGAPAPYPDPAAYTAAHEALLGDLEQHVQWLARTPAAAEAATTLVATGDLGIPGLTGLLALQTAINAGRDEDGQRTHLAQRLGHHIRCGQMTMAKIFFARAAYTSSSDLLQKLRSWASDGQFLAFGQQTEDGEMELGQYLTLRAQQIAQQAESVGVPSPAEPAPKAAQEATTMAVDHDDDIALPVFEVPGDSIMSAAEAAPRLLAEAQARLAAGDPNISILAHLHGRPVYAKVDQADTPTPVLRLGITAVNEAGNARVVSIRDHELAVVAPETLLTAVTAWLNASDEGGRPLLDYASSASAAKAAPLVPDEGTATPAEVQQSGHATATAPLPPALQSLTDSAQPLASSAPETATMTKSLEQTTPAAVAAPPAEETPRAPGPGAASEQGASSTNTRASAPEGNAASLPDAGLRQEQAGPRPGETSTAALTERPLPASAEPVDQLTQLARSTLTKLGFTLAATGVVTAERTVVITLETSGDAERDREIADRLRPALHEAIRQHPDQGLAAYRVDLEHTSQVGQSTLPSAAAAQRAAVPRERLIAANRVAAQIFTERLRDDPNAELSRTYLAEERRLPTEVQREWGLGYAPSDRGAGRWNVLVSELTARGFSEEELLHAGLATRSKYGTLIDAFADRIMFPIHDENGDIVGFSGRRVDRPGETEEQAKERGGPKYLNTSNDADLFNKGDLVFGLHHPAQAQALAQSSGPRVSVEGYLDVIAVARAAATLPIEQRPVVGAPMGTAFTERQLTVLRGLDTDNPRPHIAFLDADESGRKVLLDKFDLLVQAPEPTTVTTAPDAKDAAKLWEEGVEANGDGAAPVLRALEQRQPLLDAAVEAVLLKNADDDERANHTFSGNFFPRTQFLAAEAARYIHQTVQIQAPGDTTALKQAALTWAKRLHQEWGIPGYMTATAVLLGPGRHHEDDENKVYEPAVDLLATDPDGYFAHDSHVRRRQSASEAPSRIASGADAAAVRPGQWPAGTRSSGPVTPTSPPVSGPAPASGELVLSMFLPSPVDPAGPPVEHTDRTTAAYALHTAVHERLGQHTTESPEPDRLPQPRKLGTVYGIDLSTSGDDQTSEDPTVVVWLGTARPDSLRMSYSRFVKITGPELLAAIEWRAAQAAGLLGAPLSPTWRAAVRSILPLQFPAQPTPAQLADLLDTIAQGPDGTENRIRRRAEQAVALYTAGHPDLALNVLADDDHIWVLRNDDGSWIQEEAVDPELSWQKLETAFAQERAELADIAQERAELADIAQAATEPPPADEAPMVADLSVAHHSAHEALAALRPYSIGLPGTLYEKITDLVAQMDAGEPAMRRLHGPRGEQLMNRAKTSFVRVLEGLATVASKLRLSGLRNRLERTVARLRGQTADTLPTPRAVRLDRRMQDLAHIERDLERRMASPATTLDERGELQEQWIINRARWRARYEQLQGQPPGSDFLPDNGLIAGAPPVPNLIAAHGLLLDRLAARVAELRGTDPHTGQDANPYDPTADLLTGVFWAYRQRLIGFVPTGQHLQGPIPSAQLRQAALAVTAHQNASPLTLRRSMNVSAERADRLLHRLEQQQILGPYRADAPRTVLARPADIDALLARPASPPSMRTEPASPAPAPTTTKGPAPITADPARDGASERDAARIQQILSKIAADQKKRSGPHGGSQPADRASAAPARKTAHKEAEANALATGQSTALTPSQS